MFHVTDCRRAKLGISIRDVESNRQFQFSRRRFAVDCQRCDPCDCERHGRVEQTTLVASEGGRWVETTVRVDQSPLDQTRSGPEQSCHSTLS